MKLKLLIFLLSVGGIFLLFTISSRRINIKLNNDPAVKSSASAALSLPTAANSFSLASPSQPAYLNLRPQQPLPDIKIPKEIKAVYVSGPSAANFNKIEYLINLINQTELNSLVIDVKDNNQIWLTDWMADLVRRLRRQGIYPIARLVLFQDNQLASRRPDLALKDQAGNLWNNNGYYWVDPASQEVWDYNIAIANKALDLGFAEVNLDYIRFPDGQVNDIKYPVYDYSKFKKDVINEALQYIYGKIKKQHPDAIVSIDIFADSLLNHYDIGIGQKFLEISQYADVVAPMIYPSHYLPGNFGFSNPAEHPYEVMRQTLLAGKQQLDKKSSVIIRPWIQDFDMGAVYGKKQIAAQIQAIYDILSMCPADKPPEENQSCLGAGGGWMAWHPNNIYLKEKYDNLSAAASSPKAPNVDISP